jgi:hypothetical protein
VLALGTHVTYTYRAAVARRSRANDQSPWSEWRLTEPKHPAYGTSYSGDVLTVMTSVQPITFVAASELPTKPERRRYGSISDESWEKRNKTIMQWPDEGSGVVVGLIRRQFGISESGRTSFGGDDWDPGYFSVFGQLSLYVVKAELRGAETYVPEHAIHIPEVPT